MAPGMWHCKDGPGPNAFGGSIQQQAPSYDPKYDLLSGLTQWVERSIPPQSVIADFFKRMKDSKLALADEKVQQRQDKKDALLGVSNDGQRVAASVG